MSVAKSIAAKTHFALGISDSSPCGHPSMWHGGFKYTRKIEQVTCLKCLAWLKRNR